MKNGRCQNAIADFSNFALLCDECAYPMPNADTCAE